MVHAQQFEIERTDFDSDIVYYAIALDEFDVSNLLAYGTSFRLRLYSAFSDRVKHDRRSGVLEERSPKLTAVAMVRNDDEYNAVLELLTDLRKTWIDRQGDDRVLFSANLTRDYFVPQVTFGALTEEQQMTLNASSSLWKAIADFERSDQGESLEGDALVNFAVQTAIDDPDPLSGMRGTIIAVGIWLGDELVANGGFKWVNLTDEYGSCLCVHKTLPSGEHRYTDPFNVVRKQLEAGEVFDARELVVALLVSLNSQE